MMLGVASDFSSSEDEDQAPARDARSAATSTAAMTRTKQGQALLLQAHDRVVGTLTVTDTEATFVAGKITVTVPLSEDAHLRGGQIDLLPDRARRSRHQDNLFPLALLAPEPEGDPEAPRIELLVAFETGSEMWEWAEALRWGSTPPQFESTTKPYLHASTTSSINANFEDPHTLQETILKLDHYIGPTAAEQQTYHRHQPTGELLFYALTGSCIHEAERNVELLLSTGRIDFDAEPGGWRSFKNGNSPMSMCCEGNHSPSRAHIIDSLLKAGHPMGRGVQAASSSPFVRMITKPYNLGFGHSTIMGRPVHEDDKRLAERLIELGDGIEENEKFREALETAIDQPGVNTFKHKAGWCPDPSPYEDALRCAERELVNQATQFGRLKRRMAALRNRTARLSANHGLDTVATPLVPVAQCDDFCVDHYTPVIGAVHTETHGKFQFNGNFTTRLTFPPAAPAWAHQWVRVLDLSHNGLTTLPEELFSVFANVEHLDLSRNCLWEISPSIKQLTKLKKLCLTQNLLDALPEELALMPALEDVNVKTNPILYPPQAVTSQGWSVIKSFFEGVLKHGAVKNTDLKVLVVGLSEAGKTSLINGITSGHSALVRQGDRTVGIEQKKWSFPRNNGDDSSQDVNLLLYDFAGQQEYYITHHIFLTERALYVLAFDLSKYSSATFHDQINFWMTSIQERVPGSKVMLVGTHADKLEPSQAKKLCDKIKTTLRNQRSRTQKRLEKKIDRADVLLEAIGANREVYAKNKMSIESGVRFTVISALKDMDEKGEALTEEQNKQLTVFKEHRDSDLAIGPTARAAEKSLRQSTALWSTQLHNLAEVPSEVYAVSSANLMEGMAGLVDSIKDTVQDRTYFPELDEMVPTFYTAVRRAIRAKRNEQQFYFMRTPDYLQLLASELGLTMREVHEASSFMHALGEILYFNAEHRSDGLDVTFLKVSFLIDAFKFVVRHDHRDASTFREDAEIGLTRAEFNCMKDDLLNQGLLHLPFLEQLWAPPAPEGIGLRRQQNPEEFWSLVQLLEQFEVAAVLNTDTVSNNPTALLVPEFEPLALPASAWGVTAPAGATEAQRFFQFDSVPPHGIVQRFQVKVCPLASKGALHPFAVAKDGLSVSMLGCSVFCQLVQGKNPKRPTFGNSSWGFQIIVRGQEARLWKCTNTVVTMFEELLDQWPGLPVEHFAVADSIAKLLFLPIRRLRTEAEAGLDFSGMHKLRLVDLLGPEDAAGKWQPDEMAAGGVVAVVDSAGGDAAVADEVRTSADELMALQLRRLPRSSRRCPTQPPTPLAVSQGTAVVQSYRDNMPDARWVMLLCDARSLPLAAEVFELLTARGVPTWIKDYSGAHGTARDQIIDGIKYAAVVAPILTDAYQHDAVSQLHFEMATYHGLPVRAIVAEQEFAPNDWAIEQLFGKEHGTETFPVFEGAAADTIAGFLAAVTGSGLVKTLAAPVAGGALPRRERRKSFSQDDEAMRTVSGAAAAAATTPSTLEQVILSLELGISEDDASTYAAALRASFQERFAHGGDDSILLLYDADELEALGIPKAHCDRILLWIEQCKLSKRGLGVSADSL